ncbi:MAG: hypothetical protein OEY43_07495 [Gammaproteobacteria bacterium]|nr:hypothetical protein [Gammaproteobacteria bacterium]
MSHILGGINKKSSTTELEIIDQKRQALQKLVKLTATLNRLHQGLQAVLLMGQSASEIPQKIIDKFKSLSDRLKSQPTETLKNTLSSTDLKIQSDIRHVLEISQKSEAELLLQMGADNDRLTKTIDHDVHEHVNDFKKKSQASIALRLALKGRKIIMRAFNLPVPRSFIEQQIRELDRREARCRKRIKTDIDSLQTDIKQILANPDCADEIKQQLHRVQQNLVENRACIDEGKTIEELPMLYESIELSATPYTIEEMDSVTPAIRQVNTQTQPAPNKKIKKRSLLSMIIEWVHSPMSVKWKDIKKYK